MGLIFYLKQIQYRDNQSKFFSKFLKAFIKTLNLFNLLHILSLIFVYTKLYLTAHLYLKLHYR